MLFPNTQTGTFQEISQISHPRQVISVQGAAIRTVHGSHGVHCNSKRSQTAKEPKQVFDFVGYQFNLKCGKVRPTPYRWQALQEKIQELISLPACPVRQFMSLIGLLTATEKQVHLGRLHMRPIQWHLKNNCRVPGENNSHSKILASPSEVVAGGRPCSLRPTITPSKTPIANISKEGWGAHLNKHSARGSWSLPESKLHINYLELKVVFPALKEFQDLCSDKIVLIATDNTTVVSYINKEGGMRSGPLCALLWRIPITLNARHIPGHLNVVADKLSRLGQTIQTEWSLLPEVFQTLCSRWHQPEIDLFAMRFNKLPQFVSPDAMMSRCLDRKEVRCATWRVHSTGTGRPVETQDVFSDIWRAGLRRPD